MPRHTRAKISSKDKHGSKRLRPRVFHPSTPGIVVGIKPAIKGVAPSTVVNSWRGSKKVMLTISPRDLSQMRKVFSGLYSKTGRVPKEQLWRGKGRKNRHWKLPKQSKSE